jgi:hypothetical protein
LASRRLGWFNLKPATRKRYISNGITQRGYEQGQSLQKARGHAATPEHGGPSYSAKAIRANVEMIWPGFRNLPKAEQNRIGKDYILGMFTKGTGPKLSPAERIKRGLHKSDNRVYRHAGDAEIEARMNFMQAFREYGGENWDSEDWETYREAYRMTFSAAA